MTRIDHIAIHCSATPAGRDFGAADIRRWHRERGWRDIGYHYVIRLDGSVEKGRPDDQPGAHERKLNRNSIAICLIGGSRPTGSPEFKRGLGKNTYTAAQWEALGSLVRKLKGKHPAASVIGHRDVPGVRKACPSFDVPKCWALESSKAGNPQTYSTL